jgi:hypothetical protein
MLRAARPWILLLDFNSAPEGYMVLDVTGGRLGIRIVPGGILIFLAVHQKTVVSRLPFQGQVEIVELGRKYSRLSELSGK